MMRRLAFAASLLPVGLLALLPALGCALAYCAAWLLTGQHRDGLLLPRWLDWWTDLPWLIRGDDPA